MFVPHVLSYAVTVLVVAAALGAFLAVSVAAYAALAPHMERLQKTGSLRRKKPTLDYNPCCPPGVACNDPTHRSGVAGDCRRRMATRAATVEEAIELEGLWSRYHGESTERGRKAALALFAMRRDDIIVAALRAGGQKPAQLAEHTPAPPVQGDVVPPMRFEDYIPYAPPGKSRHWR